MLILATPSAEVEHSNDAINEHLKRCVPLIDEYIVSAPLGQFQARLELLDSFGRFSELLRLHCEPFQAAAFEKISGLVRSQTKHYRLILSNVQDELLKGREPIQKEISDYVKLASWKDTNVYALKQSAEKTHRHLHRCIRKYRELLRRPVAAINASPFRPILGSPDNIMGPNNFPTWRSPPPRAFSGSDVPHRFAELNQTHSRFQYVLREEIIPRLQGQTTSQVEELATLVIERIQQLSLAPISDDERNRRKSINSLVTRKRRAIIDLMQELRRLGVSQHPKADTLTFQESKARLFELSLPTNCSDNALFDSVNRGDRYYHRLIDGLQDVRDSMSSHHSDLSTRDLQRLLSLAQSLFAFGITARQK